MEWRIVPKPEVLVDYYRSLVERSEGFKIEEEIKSDQESSEEDMEVTEANESSMVTKEAPGKGKEGFDD